MEEKMLNSMSSVGSQYNANVFASTFTQKNQSVSAVEEKPVFVERYTAPETNEDTSGVSDKNPVGPKQILIDPLGKNYKFQPASQTAVEEKPVFVERYIAPKTNEDISGVSDKTPEGPKQIPIDPLGKNYKFQPASQTAVEEKPVFVERYTAPETNEDTSGVSDKNPVGPKQIPIDLYQEVPEYKPAKILA
jgi:hypothetical protein